MKEAIDSFFESYPDAPCVHEVSGQLFHDNAKDAAEARAKFYGLEVVTHTKGISNTEQGILNDEVAPLESATEDTAVEAESKAKKGKKR